MVNEESAEADRLFNEHLAQELDETKAELAKMRALLERPINVNVQSAEAGTLHKIGEYLPQLSHLATNVSHVASAIQTNGGSTLPIRTNELLERIAVSLERIAGPDEQWNQDQEDGT